MTSFRVLVSFAFVAIARSVVVIESHPPQESYQHSRKISEHVHLSWEFTDESISFQVQGRTTGWIGIGFSNKGNMIGADIAVGWVDENGKAFVTDRHGPASINAFPPLDSEQNLRDISGTEIDGWTIISFTRDRGACDEMHDKPINDGTQRIIWAMGQSDPSDGELSAYDRHTSSDRGAISVYLFQAFHDKTFTEPEYKTFDITTKNLSLPAATSYHNCRIVKLPKFDKKQHIVQMEPLIQQENIANVHHMLIFMCRHSWTPDDTWQVEKNVQCDGLLGFLSMHKPCSDLFMVWAVGGLATTLPDVTGIPIGEYGIWEDSYVLLETHYNNPTGVEGIIDSSGMRFTYTPNLRKYDTGVYPIGQLVYGLLHYIPPGAESFTTKTPCVSGCITSILRSEDVPDITLHHVILHSHLAGRKMKLRHFRNRTELPFVINDEAYDFNYQEYVALDPFVTILQGDELQMECTYNTEDRDHVTQSGWGIEEELCFAYVLYYPAVHSTGCISYTNAKDSLEYFGVSSLFQPNGEHSSWSLEGNNVVAPSPLAGKTLLEVVSEYNWTQEHIREFEKHVHEKQKHHICVPGIHDVSIIQTDSPYVPPTHTCVGSWAAAVSTMNVALMSVAYAICRMSTIM